MKLALVILLKRFRENPLSIVFSIVSMGLLLGFFLRKNDIDERQASLEGLEAALSLVKTDLQEAKTLDLDISAQQDLIKKIESRLMNRDTQTLNTRYLYTFSERANVEILDPVQESGSDRNIYKMEGFSPIPFTLSIKSNYENMVRFFYYFRCGEYFSRITGFRITNNNGIENDDLTVALDIDLLGKKVSR